MYSPLLIKRLILFTIGFSVIFYVIRESGFVPQNALSEETSKIIPLFSGITVVFSIISGFIIQAQWHKWDTLLDAARGEVNMLRHMYIMAGNFPSVARTKLQKSIEIYLDILLKKSNPKQHHRGVRSEEVDEAMYDIDKQVYFALEKYNQTGMGMFMLFNRAMEFREQRIQNGSQRLPFMLKALIILLTIILVAVSFFIFFDNIWFEFIFRLILALLAYTVYLIIEDLDDPFRPGNWHLTFKGYKELSLEIKKKKN